MLRASLMTLAAPAVCQCLRQLDGRASVSVWGLLAPEAVEHLGVDLWGLGFVVGVQHAADAQFAFGVEVVLAPLGVCGAGLVGILVVVQDEGGEQHVGLVEVEGMVPTGGLVQAPAFVAGEQVEPGCDGMGVGGDVTQCERASQLRGGGRLGQRSGDALERPVQDVSELVGGQRHGRGGQRVKHGDHRTAGTSSTVKASSRMRMPNTPFREAWCGRSLGHAREGVPTCRSVDRTHLLG